MWYQPILTWFTENWWIIVLILLAAYLARKFIDITIETVVRRTITPHIHTEYTPEDIKKRQDTIISMLSAVARVLIWIIAFFAIISRFGFDPTSLIAGASIIGIALGFGAQSLVKDFLSGVFIILENQYRVGDVVTLDGAEGKVEQITIRSTVLRDNDGSVHYIPNGAISHTINKTMGYARINLTISVAPSTDVDKLAGIIDQIGNKMAKEEKWHKRIIDAPRFQSIGNFTNTTMEVKIIGKMQPSAQWSVTGELRKRLLAALYKEGIGLAAVSAPTPSGKKK